MEGIKEEPAIKWWMMYVMLLGGEVNRKAYDKLMKEETQAWNRISQGFG